MLNLPLRKVSACALLLFASFTAFAQNARPTKCYTDEHRQEMEAANPSLIAKRAALEAQIHALLANQPPTPTARTGRASRIIPTVVHIVHEFGTENISKASVLAHMAQINKDMMRRNSDTNNPRTLYAGVASDLDFEFRLATIDPDGKPTDGITRVQHPYTVLPAYFDSVKYVRNWDTRKYFNIWVVKSIQTVGQFTVFAYAQFPLDGEPWETWGVVAIADVWDIFNTFPHTVSHEVGHCFNLLHTFEGSCGASCDTTGDNVCDTPPVKQDTYGCDVTQNSCNNDSPDQVDQIENFMSYDACQNMFTKGQRARVDAAVAIVPEIQGLISKENLKHTGVDDSSFANPAQPKPVAYFGSAKEGITCAGTPVKLQDGSFNGTIDNTWEFTYKVPGTKQRVFRGFGDAGRDITVVFDSAGNFPITQIVRNVNGIDSITRVIYKVGPGTGSIKVAGGVNYVEGFDGTTLNADPDPYKNYATDGSKSTFALFATSAPGGTSGSHALRVPNSGTGVTAGVPRYLYTPSIDISGWVGNPKFYFYRALARRTNAYTTDSLAVDWSTNCGLNWTNKKNWVMRTTKPLYTTNAIWTSQSNWTPTGSNWVLDSIPLVIAGTARQNVRLRFAMYPGNANALYLDNFQIGSIYQRITGVSMPLSPFCAECLGLEVVPNPATNSAVLEIANGAGNNVLSVWDAAGRMVAQKTLSEAGSQSISLQSIAPGLQNGVYMVRLQHGQGQVQKRMVIAN